MMYPDKLKVNDVIVCIDKDTNYGKLTLGREYTVIQIHPNKKRIPNEEWFYVQEDTGELFWYYSYQFERLEDLKSDGWNTP